VFDALHRRVTMTEGMLLAFDLLELDGVDYQLLPLGERKTLLARLVDRRLAGIAMVAARVRPLMACSGRTSSPHCDRQQAS